MPAALALPELELSEAHESLLNRGLFPRELELRAQSINQESRSFEAVVASENRAQVFDPRTGRLIDEILVAGGGQFPERSPLLPDHRRFNVFDVCGSVTNFRRENTEWVGTGTVARSSPGNTRLDDLWMLVADSHVNSVSIGYEVNNFVDLRAGDTRTISGRTFNAGANPLRVTTAWRVHEVSLTAIPADEYAQIRKRLVCDSKPKQRSYFR